MRAYRVLGAMVIGATFAFGMPEAVSWAMSPQAPKVVRTPRAQIIPLPKGDLDLTDTLSMKPAEGVVLRKRVEKNRGDALARAKLMGYTAFHRDEPDSQRLHNEQVVWFAANLPDSPVLSSGEVDVDMHLNARTYDLVKRLYDEALAKQPKNVGVIANYAALTLVSENDVAVSLLKQATALSPKSAKLYERLAFAHYLGSRHVFGGRDKEEASRAVDAYLKARSLGKEPSASYFLESAYTANRLDVVEREAKAMLSLAGDADAFHNAHTILGRLALKRGRIDEAKRHLLESAKVTGSPVLGSFGPSMDLAKELLEEGDRSTVLAYLRATGKFWDDDRQRRWTKQLENGQTPDWD